MKLWTMGMKLTPLGHLGEPAPIPDWAQADPRWIERALHRASALPTGGWFVVEASRRIARSPRAHTIAGRRVVVWKADGQLRAAPEACPHMGASLEGAVVKGDEIVCPWHGLCLGPRGHGAWRPYRTWDDGVLAWVRLDAGDEATDRPILPERPARFMDGVIRVEATCEPSDVLANRLDPWHGVHFHPYSFGRLRVISMDDTEVTVRVAYRVVGPISVEVDARFHCSDARTIVMTIVDGEGKGSVVETHATPLGSGRTAIIEATLATSERRGFGRAMLVAPLIRPLIERAANRLWVDDAAYAERRYALRTRGEARASNSGEKKNLRADS